MKQSFCTLMNGNLTDQKKEMLKLMLIQHNDSRLPNRSTFTHLLLRKFQNCNSLLNNYQQENVGPTQKRYPTSKGKGEAPVRWQEVQYHVQNQTPYPPEQLRVLKLNLVCTRTQGLHKRPSQSCLYGFECLLQRHGSAKAFRGDRVSSCCRPGRHGIWKSLLEGGHHQPHHRAAKQMTHKLENSYTKRFSHCCKSSSKGTETPREFNFEGQWDLTTELPQDWGNRFLEGTNKILCPPGPRRKEQ